MLGNAGLSDTIRAQLENAPYDSGLRLVDASLNVGIRAHVVIAKDLLRLIMGEGGQLIALGVVAGLAVAVALSRVLASFLYEIAPTDPLTLTTVGVLFAAVALMACWVPARRAALVDPLDALREG